jgi:hypothetical protein
MNLEKNFRDYPKHSSHGAASTIITMSGIVGKSAHKSPVSPENVGDPRKGMSARVDFRYADGVEVQNKFPSLWDKPHRGTYLDFLELKQGRT